jgi:hypothetical protein
MRRICSSSWPSSASDVVSISGKSRSTVSAVSAAVSAVVAVAVVVVVVVVKDIAMEEMEAGVELVMSVRARAS